MSGTGWGRGEAGCTPEEPRDTAQKRSRAWPGGGRRLQPRGQLPTQRPGSCPLGQGQAEPRCPRTSRAPGTKSSPPSQEPGSSEPCGRVAPQALQVKARGAPGLGCHVESSDGHKPLTPLGSSVAPSTHTAGSVPSRTPDCRRRLHSQRRHRSLPPSYLAVLSVVCCSSLWTAWEETESVTQR